MISCLRRVGLSPWFGTPDRLSSVATETKRRNLWPLPGGVSAYPETLRVLLEGVNGGTSRQNIEDAIMALKGSVRSSTTVRGYAAVLRTLGLIERSADSQVAL